MAKAKKQYSFELPDQTRYVYATVEAKTEAEALRKIKRAYPKSNYGEDTVGKVRFSYDYRNVDDAPWGARLIDWE
jgi:hypothetical protein